LERQAWRVGIGLPWDAMPSGDEQRPVRGRTAGGISLQTLLIASVASAVTSYVVSRVWGPGTIIGAAASPVLVALVAESLRKPVETVSATARRVPVVVQPVAAGRPRPREQHGDADVTPPVDPGYVATLEADETLRATARSGPRWGLVLATAAAAFAIVVAIYTIPDLVAGKSITGSGNATTFFGGPRSSGSSSQTTKTTTTGGQGTTSTSTGTKTTTTTKTVTTTAPATTTTPAPTTTSTTPTTSTTSTTSATSPTLPPTPVTPTTGTAPPGSTPPPTP
jgi:hypothetical protein